MKIEKWKYDDKTLDLPVLEENEIDENYSQEIDLNEQTQELNVNNEIEEQN